MSNELVPVSRSDRESAIVDVAMPLFDLRDTSLQALDQSKTTAGDLQSQLLLAYRGNENQARVFSRSFLDSNRLGMFKWLQAFTPLPIAFALLGAFELPVMLMTFLPNRIFLQVLAMLFFISATTVLTAFTASRVLFNRKKAFTGGSRRDLLASVFEPDHIAISPQGLNLQWSSKHCSFMGLVLPWKRIALAYAEEHIDPVSNEKYEILCIRDNVGKALRLDCRQFASDVLVKAFLKRAPWSVKAPPMVLAMQPAQSFRWQYLLRWASSISKFRKDGARVKTSIVSGSLLKGGKYKVIETFTLRKLGVDHLAEVLTSGGGNTSGPVSYKGLNSYEPVEHSCLTRVLVQQFVVPLEQTFLQWYWTLHHFETEVRRLSSVNSNNITRWLDVFAENGSLFVVTEYDASPSLRQIVRESGPLPEARVREIALEMCEILLHLHQLDPPYVHKSFTPDALVLAKEGFVKLNQFTLGQQLVPSQMFASYLDRRYTSFELLRDRPSHQSDIYSFGCTLFYLLTGEDPKPFQQSNPRLIRPEISERFNHIVLKATEPSANARFDSVSDIKDAILELACSETSLVLL